MGQEFELKYRAEPACLAAIRASCGPFREIAMETTYYDAPDGALSARKWTLRHRLENGLGVCTLKTPGENHIRGEWETESGDIALAIPVLCKLGAPAELLRLTEKGLITVCGAKFTRLACTLEVPGAALELALDQGVLTGGGRELPLCEVEVELKAGNEEAAVAFAAELARRWELTPEPRSKFRRALDLARNPKNR